MSSAVRQAANLGAKFSSDGEEQDSNRKVCVRVPCSGTSELVCVELPAAALALFLSAIILTTEDERKKRTEEEDKTQQEWGRMRRREREREGEREREREMIKSTLGKT